jgi:hypothetical protein
MRFASGTRTHALLALLFDGAGLVQAPASNQGARTTRAMRSSPPSQCPTGSRRLQLTAFERARRRCRLTSRWATTSLMALRTSHPEQPPTVRAAAASGCCSTDSKLPPGVELAGYAAEWIQENPNAAEEARAGATATAAKRKRPASAKGKAAGPRPPAPVRDDSSSSDS